MPRPLRFSVGACLLATASLASACGQSDTPATRDTAGASIRRGHALLTATRDSLPQHVGNALRCTSCHLNDGRQPSALPWIGVTGRYPQYRSRNDAVSTIEDRINDCFARSLNGSPVPPDSRDMRDMVAYMASLTGSVSKSDNAAGDNSAPMTPLTPDSARGAALFATTCVSCHGDLGQGTAIATPLWGAQSYNIGAGMARLRTAASFVRHNMPFGNATLTDQQAFDVAAYINSRPRPDFPGKEKDWPRGDAPPDVPYRTDAGRAGTPARSSR